MDDTFTSKCLFVYFPHLYVDISIMFSGLPEGLGFVVSVFKFVWQCRNPLSVRNKFPQQLHLAFPLISLTCFSSMIACIRMQHFVFIKNLCSK